MRKIPTLFVRNPETHKIEPVLSEGCEWVLQGEGTATRKVDGTAVLIRNGRAYKRREVKPGRTPPADFERIETDETTGKEVGWVPVHPTDPCDRYFVEGIHRTEIAIPPPRGETYELVGPKVQGNTENLDRHTLIPHNSDRLHIEEPPRIAGDQGRKRVQHPRDVPVRLPARRHRVAPPRRATGKDQAPRLRPPVATEQTEARPQALKPATSPAAATATPGRSRKRTPPVPQSTTAPCSTPATAP